MTKALWGGAAHFKFENEDDDEDECERCAYWLLAIRYARSAWVAGEMGSGEPAL
jgi:hypothetical protein